jgi:hypothetical protein
MFDEYHYQEDPAVTEEHPSPVGKLFHELLDFGEYRLAFRLILMEYQARMWLRAKERIDQKRFKTLGKAIKLHDQISDAILRSRSQ